ncbi:MAG TPA: UbiX family flavin prenyltransferase [Anaerolineae bacterium]|nr:UbiX family flavin prenyltransferase [Anaerolineae bacterium]
MELVVAITGASGVTIGARLLEVLACCGEHHVHAIVSDGARAVIAQEMGATVALPATSHWECGDLAAPISSSSRAPDAMVIAPCSMKTLSAVAHGYADNLIVRVAAMMLRLNRPLILMPRETPLALADIENMRLTRLAGAVLLPPIVAYYPNPRTIEDVTDFFAGKVLDMLGLPHQLYRRWAE